MTRTGQRTAVRNQRGRAWRHPIPRYYARLCPRVGEKSFAKVAILLTATLQGSAAAAFGLRARSANVAVEEGSDMALAVKTSTRGRTRPDAKAVASTVSALASTFGNRL